MFEHLTQPIQVGTMTLRNRMVQPAMGSNLNNSDGTVTDGTVYYYGTRANGGVGLIITEVCTPEPGGRCIPGQLELSHYRFIPGLARLVSAAHSGGAKIAVQLAHAGCFASESVTDMQPCSPSGIGTFILPDDKPRAMTIEEVRQLIEAYGMAAQRATLAGFDAVEVHGGHGYMPLQFLSGYSNRRTDEYGGSLENRARFALEVIRSIKEHAGEDFPIIYRLSAEEYVEGGLVLEETTQFARWAEEAGVSAIHVTAGTWDSRIETFNRVMAGQESPAGKRLSEGMSTGIWVPPTYVPRGIMVPLAEAIKKNVSVPIIAVNSISPEMAEEIIASGKADMVAMGRQIIADPEYPRKVIAGKPEEIRRCIRCNECLSAAVSYRGIECSVNAVAGKEHEFFTKLVPANKSRKVMVVGGGPGGMEAARVGAIRGHDVTLYEKRNELGGMMLYSAVPDFKKDIRDFLQCQKYDLSRQGVRVVTGTAVTVELIKKRNPDAVIVATGARPFRPAIDGIDDSGIYDALDVLGGNTPQGKRVIVCGAGLIGVEVGMFLAESHNKQVVVVDKLPSVVPDELIFTQQVIRAKLAEDGVEVRVNHCITCVTPTSVRYTYEGSESIIEGDAVVLALGMTADPTLYNELQKLPIEVIAIGDAVKARKIINAVHEGFHAGRRI